MKPYMSCDVKLCLTHSFRLSVHIFYGGREPTYTLETRHPSKELSGKKKMIRTEVPSPRKARSFFLILFACFVCAFQDIFSVVRLICLRGP